MTLFKNLFSLKQKEIDAAFTSARLLNNVRGLKLLQTPHSSVPQTLEHGKLLIIISKKVGKAHDRNRLRRQLKTIFYEEQLYTQPVVSILIVYPHALTLSFDEIKNFLVSSF